jgi:hypothetical protein
MVIRQTTARLLRQTRLFDAGARSYGADSSETVEGAQTIPRKATFFRTDELLIQVWSSVCPLHVRARDAPRELACQMCWQFRPP